MTTAEKVEAMKAWYAGIQLPDGPLPYKQGEIIQRPAHFVETQLLGLECDHRTRFFRNAYMRLYELKRYIEFCPKNV